MLCYAITTNVAKLVLEALTSIFLLVEFFHSINPFSWVFSTRVSCWSTFSWYLCPVSPVALRSENSILNFIVCCCFSLSISLRFGSFWRQSVQGAFGALSSSFLDSDYWDFSIQHTEFSGLCAAGWIFSTTCPASWIFSTMCLAGWIVSTMCPAS